MFESLKHWIEKQDDDSKLFENAESELIHVALASVLFHIISADGLETSHEKHKFALILKNEFNLSEEQSSSLYYFVKALKSDLKSDLTTVNEYLKDNPNIRMQLMAKLNQLIAVDGVNNEELEVFYDAMKVIFPEVAKKMSDF